MKEPQDSSIIRECVKFIEESKKEFIELDTPFKSDENEECFVIEEDRIFQIFECKDFRKMGFIDGGNAPILNGGDFNISFCRVAGLLMNENQWVHLDKTPLVIEFYTGTVIKSLDNGKMVYLTRFFPRESSHLAYLPKNDIIFDIKDELLRRNRGFLLDINRLGGIARRFAEWTYATKFVENELNVGNILIRDGSLQTGFTNEMHLARKLFQVGLSKNVYITGLSKTCRLFTQNGDSLMATINSIASRKYPDNKWYFYPIFRVTLADNQADLYFLKLNNISSYVFRFDIYIEQSKKLNQNEREVIISNLANNSNDLSFIGYPYGLIKADQLARVSTNEINLNKYQTLAEFDEKIYEMYILPRLRSVDAHDIINNIRK